ncbi:hypothetical protein LY78DRAFT_662968 [Colletotrichum sublineola]|nr:hypothetical protein LY78DRAFT_662968 [Colletotrichum sublineola]
MDPRPFGFRCGYGGAVPSLVRAHNLLQFLCSHPRATSQPPPPLQQAFARLAQSVERETLNLKVVGSTRKYQLASSWSRRPSITNTYQPRRAQFPSAIELAILSFFRLFVLLFAIFV